MITDSLSLGGPDKTLFLGGKHHLEAAVCELLSDFLDEQEHAMGRLEPALLPLMTTARTAILSGGKRLRPTFAYWGWRGMADRAGADAAVLPALAALELMHSFALVHDDIMDASPLRRGLPTAHQALAHHHRRQQLRGGAEHFGVSAAILIGDLCLVWADELMSRADVPARALLQARRVYDRMRVETIAGQFLDVLGEVTQRWSLEKALRVAELKTAGYTVTKPLHFGAALTGRAHPEVEEAYTAYGSAVGIAFQLRDDLLDFHGDPALTGKPAGADLHATRPTVLLELARSLAGSAQRLELARLLDDPAGVDLPRLTRLIEATGAPSRVEKMVDSHVSTALQVIRTAPIDTGVRDALIDLATAAARRDS